MIRDFFSVRLNRVLAVVCGFVALSVFFSAYLFYYGAVLYGINPENDVVKETILRREMRKKTVEGSIVDANGDVITFAEQPGEAAQCVYPSYGQLVGFNSYVYGSYGLRKRFADQLFMGDKNGNGATVRLTTVNRVQNAAYQAIRGTDGCAVVLENGTGRILALVTTHPTVEMDVNDLASNWDEMMSTYGFLEQNWRKALAPGSTIKPLAATMLYDEGLADSVYTDNGGETVDGYTFHNAGKAANGNITLHRAVVTSCNTYFAHMTHQVGPFRYRESLEAFSIGKELNLDFFDITSHHHLDSANQVEIAAAGFGQGKLEVTPINVAMIGQTIANGGESLKPYLIDSVYNAKGVSQSGKTESLGRACSQEAAAFVSDCMLDAAQSYGIERSRGIHAKTGTAELGGQYRASFLAFNDRYTVCVVENHTKKAGKQLANAALQIFDVLDAL